MVVMMGFVALAIDLGMVALARTQCQAAADAAAMAGARSLNGDPEGGYNVSAVQPNAVAAAGANTVQARVIPASQVKVEVGSYTYDYGTSRFNAHIPRAASDTPNLVKATVNASGTHGFGKILGLSSFNISTTATAAHRPRDVAIIMDMSGSMRFDSLLGIPYSGSRTQSNNPQSTHPKFGHYTSSSARLRNASGPDTIGDDTYGLANISSSTDAGAAIVDDFYQSPKGSSPVPAFTPAPDDLETTPGGDRFIVRFHTDVPATNVQDITNSASSASFRGHTHPPFANGYEGPPVSEFKGYTQGPGYWGKTFFMWPPDPGTLPGHFDWRQRFFGTQDNTDLWDSSGNWRAPSSSTYSINYSQILAWIKQDPNPFPPRLRAGRILYYDQIPDSINTSSYPPSDPNQRFWKEYIDYVLGLYQRNSTTYDVITRFTGYGDDYTWGTIRISAKPSNTYMDARDNPKRPRLHFWFGAMTMIDFLGNYNLWSQYSNWNAYWPGTCHEGPLWACKLGVQAALQDIKNNHPNDFVSLMYFSTPKYSASGDGSFNRVRVPLGRDYARLKDTLWFAPATIDDPSREIRPYDAEENSDVPRAYGGTTTVMGFMLAYNQFSSNTSLRTHAPSPAPAGEAGGLGRRGAQRLIILQTDGMANSLAQASLTNSGSYNSYYRVRYPGEYPQNSGSSVTSQLTSVVSQICALDTANPPGYSTNRKPVLIHCLALGPIFDPSTDSPDRTAALNLLQNIQYIGGTQSSPSTPLSPYKIITGTSQDRQDRIREAFSTIMQDGIQVSLIE
jgi:Flp pilus assembly protein TadG